MAIDKVLWNKEQAICGQEMLGVVTKVWSGFMNGARTKKKDTLSRFLY